MSAANFNVYQLDSYYIAPNSNVLVQRRNKGEMDSCEHIINIQEGISKQIDNLGNSLKNLDIIFPLDEDLIPKNIKQLPLACSKKLSKKHGAPKKSSIKIQNLATTLWKNMGATSPPKPKKANLTL